MILSYTVDSLKLNTLPVSVTYVQHRYSKKKKFGLLRNSRMIFSISLCFYFFILKSLNFFSAIFIFLSTLQGKTKLKIP